MQWFRENSSTMQPYKVYVVVDREFGERLMALGPGVPVWIVDTPINKPVAQRLWKERTHENHLTGITTFKDWDSSTPEDLFISELDMVDLHHGSNSSDLPYTILQVVGTALSERIRAALSTYGFTEFQPSSEGFVATREKPPR
jgi:nitroreductase